MFRLNPTSNKYHCGLGDLHDVSDSNDLSEQKCILEIFWKTFLMKSEKTYRQKTVIMMGIDIHIVRYHQRKEKGLYSHRTRTDVPFYLIVANPVLSWRLLKITIRFFELEDHG